MADAAHSKGSGRTVTYKASFDDIWSAMPEVVKETDLEYVSANREDGTVLAQHGVSAFSFGESVAVFVEPVGSDRCRVEVDSKKAVATNVFATNWARPIFKRLDMRFARE
jgi:hypothetical protein